MRKALAMLTAGYLAWAGGSVRAQEGELPPAPYDFRTIECGELDLSLIHI